MALLQLAQHMERHEPVVDRRGVNHTVARVLGEQKVPLHKNEGQLVRRAPFPRDPPHNVLGLELGVAPCLGKFVQVYLDDIIVYSNKREEHVSHLRQVLDRLRHEHWVAKLSKCEFFKQELVFLGFLIGTKGVRPNPERTAALDKWPVPDTPLRAQKALGFFNFYRRFIKSYSAKARALVDLAAMRAAMRAVLGNKEKGGGQR